MRCVQVSSIDGFQGREKQLIVFSCVRCNDRGSVGFLNDARRVNVMLTRAKRGLIVIGSPDTLSKEKTTWGPWLSWCGRPCSESRPHAPADNGLITLCMSFRNFHERRFGAIQVGPVCFAGPWHVGLLLGSKQRIRTLRRLCVMDRQRLQQNMFPVHRSPPLHFRYEVLALFGMLETIKVATETIHRSEQRRVLPVLFWFASWP